MAKARNPKPEIRRRPKGASSATPAAAPARRTHASPPIGGLPFLRSTPTEIAVLSGATAEGINVGQASRLSVVPRPKRSGTRLSHAPAEIGQRRSDASLTQTGETPVLRPVRLSAFGESENVSGLAVCGAKAAASGYCPPWARMSPRRGWSPGILSRWKAAALSRPFVFTNALARSCAAPAAETGFTLAMTAAQFSRIRQR